MKIQVGNLSEGIHTYQFHEKASELGLGEEFAGDIHVEATLDKTANQIALKGSVRATGRFLCDRCAATFEKDSRPTTGCSMCGMGWRRTTVSIHRKCRSSPTG